MNDGPPHGFVSRAGLKLARAFDRFGIDPRGQVCADLGSSTGGFVDCLLQRGAAKVYAVDRGYGVLVYRLRNDPRVAVLERTDARTVRLPEPVGLVTIDVGWTRQAQVLGPARGLLGPGGAIVTLVKPHYEADPAHLRDGVLDAAELPGVLQSVRDAVAAAGLSVVDELESPILGRGGNREFLWRLGAA